MQFVFKATILSDKNECMMGICDGNSTCINSEGSYQCHCNAGFTGDGITCQMIGREMKYSIIV